MNKINKKLVWFGLFFSFCIGLYYLPYASIKSYKVPRQLKNDIIRPMSVLKIIDNQQERIDMVTETCHKYGYLLKSKAYKKHEPPFFEARKYNWSYCKIGKIGSTVWTQFFYILHHKDDWVRDVLNKPRQEIHERETNGSAVYGLKESFKSTRMVLSARNPYTRLFSSYIDRMFLPSTTESIRGEEDFKCKTEITFSEFLKLVVENTKKGVYEYHWTPIFYFCNPCKLSPSFVFKQETFKNDFDYVINNTKLEPYKKAVLSMILRDQSKWTGYAIIDDVMDRIAPINQHRTLNCLTWEQIVNRIWEALKIQGFITDNAPFPSERYRKFEDFKNPSILREAVRYARKKYKPSSAEKLLQRQNALNRFYRTVDEDTIKAVQEVFRPDFEMFGYSLEPPS